MKTFAIFLISLSLSLPRTLDAHSHKDTSTNILLERLNAWQNNVCPKEQKAFQCYWEFMIFRKEILGYLLELHHTHDTQTRETIIEKVNRRTLEMRIRYPVE